MNRRELLAAGASAALLARAPAFALGSEDRALRAALDGLGNASPEAKLDRLKSFSPGSLTLPSALDLLTVRSGLAIDTQLARAFPFGRLGRSPYSVSLTSGAWRDAGAAPARIDADSAAITVDAASGVVLPKFLLGRTIAAIRNAAASRDDGAKAAMMRQAVVLEALASKSSESPGIGRLRDGETYFGLMLERQSGERIDAAVAHQRFIDTAHGLHARADKVLRRLGLARGTVGERIVALYRQEKWLYPDDDGGRDHAVADMNRWLDRARARLLASFGTLPTECLDVSARRISPRDEAAHRQGYRVVGGLGKSGVYFVDLADIRRRPSWSLASVVHHELLPGHMIQMPIEQRADPHPQRIEYAFGFAEGWAIYAEQLAAEQGAFDGNDRALLGHLHWLLFRVARAAIDTGIHVMGWSVDKALQTLREIQGEPAYFASFESEIDRVCVEPGIRAAEALNWLALADHAARAPHRMAFHRALLDPGRRRIEHFDFLHRNKVPS